MLVAPSMWDDPQFLGTSRDTRLVWLYLLTGHESTLIPGLLRATVSSIADGMRFSIEETHLALQSLIKIRFIEFDAAMRLLRIPEAPKYSPPGNWQVLMGWYRRWLATPESTLKHVHVRSLHAPVARLMQVALDSGDQKKADGWRKAWDNTFGKIPLPKDNQQNLFGVGGLVDESSTPRQRGVRRDPHTEIRDLDPVSGRVDEVSMNFHTPSEQEPKRPSEDLRNRASSLWTLQETLRAELPDMPPLRPTDAALERVGACLATTGASDHEADHVLRVYQADAKRDANKRQWFDGVVNWKPKNFTFALGRPIDANPASGRNEPFHFKVTPSVKYEPVGKVAW